MKITVHTSCGQTFEEDLEEMSDRQIEGLLAQNGDRKNADPRACGPARRTRKAARVRKVARGRG
jgi:hypothetical protein